MGRRHEALADLRILGQIAQRAQITSKAQDPRKTCPELLQIFKSLMGRRHDALANEIGVTIVVCNRCYNCLLQLLPANVVCSYCRICRLH